MDKMDKKIILLPSSTSCTHSHPKPPHPADHLISAKIISIISKFLKLVYLSKFLKLVYIMN